MFMGLIKDKCAICLTPTTKLLSLKLGDGGFICDACSKSVSDAFRHYYLESLTVDEFKEYLSQKNLEKKLSTQFNKTRIFRINDKDVLYADEKNGLWCDASDSNPDVFRMDQVIDCYLADAIPKTHKDIYYSSVEEEVVFETIVFKLNHPFISRVQIILTNTKSPSYSEDHMVGNDIVDYFNKNNIS